MTALKSTKGTTAPIEVANPAFLLERLAADCAPLQEYRELTRNAIEAIERRCQEETRPVAGTVVWDVDWALTKSNVYKLCCIDDGVGMSGPEIEKYINHLSSSASRQGLDANFGLGARITAGHKNPAGLMYFSWKAARGVSAIFWRDDTAGVYGLQQLQRPDGQYGTFAPAPNGLKPDEITEWGTKVTLCGERDDQDTVVPPKVSAYRSGEAPGGMKWLTEYLNRRFFRFPHGITVSVRELSYREKEKWPTAPERSVTKGAQLRTVEGAKFHLDLNSDEKAKGTIEVTGARVHWWLLNEKNKSGKSSLADSRESWETRGHVAALYQDELYELRRLQEGYRMLKMFGVTVGFERVVIYVEPIVGAGNQITANTARSHLRMNGDELPWVAWAAEFRTKLPPILKKMMDDLLSASGLKDHNEAIKKRLQAIADFLRVEKYRRTQTGKLSASGTASGGTPADSIDDVDGDEGRPRPQPPLGGRKGSLLAGLLDDEHGDPATPIIPKLDQPTVIWASRVDGTRAEGEMEDRAASYVAETNILKINADFRVFQSLKQRFIDEAGDIPGAEKQIGEIVDEWIQQQLVEAVMGIRVTLEGGKFWAAGSEELKRALSEESLTVAVMPRYHLIYAIRRVVHQRLPSLAKKEAARGESAAE